MQSKLVKIGGARAQRGQSFAEFGESIYTLVVLFHAYRTFVVPCTESNHNNIKFSVCITFYESVFPAG